MGGEQIAPGAEELPSLAMSRNVVKSAPGARRAGEAGPLEGAVILVGEADEASAAAARATLKREGAADVIWRKTVHGVATAVADGGVDMAQIDLSLPGGEPLDIVRRIRRGVLGVDPFLPIVLTTWRVEGANISAALEAGADDVVAKPYSSATIAERIKRLVVYRKPFVANGDYVGPLHAGMAEKFKAAQTFDAPTMLKALGVGDGHQEPTSQTNLEVAERRITNLRAQICAKDVARAASLALASYIPPMWDAGDCRALRNRAVTLRDANKTVVSDKLSAILECLASLADVGAAGNEDAEKAAMVCVELAEIISQAIEREQEDDVAFPAAVKRLIDNHMGAD